VRAPARPKGVSPVFHAALVERLATDAFDLPTLDEAAARVVALTARPDSDLSEATEALEGCPEVSERVLFAAGSALYATREPAEDVRTAAGRLGMRAVGELAVAALVYDRLYGPLVGSTREAKDLWRKAAVAGVYAYRLTKMRRKGGEGTLLAGLLADVGQPLVLVLLNELENALGEPLLDSARATLVDALHVAVGVALVRSWSLPRQVVLAVAFHHAFDQAPSGCEQAAVACLSEWLSRRLFSAHGSEQVGDHPAAKALGLSAEELERLMSDPEEVIEAARSLG
jgi:HD-like signal output (HDOD) protein